MRDWRSTSLRRETTFVCAIAGWDNVWQELMHFLIDPENLRRSFNSTFAP